MLEPRWRANPLGSVPGISTKMHVKLHKVCIQDKNCWSSPPKRLKKSVNAFRLAVKEAYRLAQGNRCCYCCETLTAHGRAYDGEHVLHQSDFSKFTFTLGNLCSSCITCNQAKGSVRVLSAVWAGMSPIVVPQTSDDYDIVHPHIDEWHDHLSIDPIDRIQAITEKGKFTIATCGLGVKNDETLRNWITGATTQPDVVRRTFMNPYRSDSWRLDFLQIMHRLNQNGEAVAVGRMAEELEGHLALVPAQN